MTTLFKIVDGHLERAVRKPLSKESLIEQWVEENPRLLGLDAIIIGRQVPTAHGKFIDLLGLDRAGALIIIELKKNRTPREVVAQVLDYASWIRSLTTPEIYELHERYQSESLSVRFESYFDEKIPERLNSSHSMVIVASEMDAASKRIVEYLSEEHSVAINTAFFEIFESCGEEWLTTDFLLDQAEVEERSERKTKAPWSGYYFVNGGDDARRSWRDMVRYGFVSAGYGSFYSKRLDQLQPGDKIFVYQKGRGYVGYGIVTTTKVPAAEFRTASGLLFEQPLEREGIKEHAQDPELAEYAVGVDWIKTVDLDRAKTFSGAFANQNIVCKLRDQATLDFLIREFGVDS